MQNYQVQPAGQTPNVVMAAGATGQNVNMATGVTGQNASMATGHETKQDLSRADNPPAYS